MRRGTVIDGQPDWRKGSTWVLERDESGAEPVITAPTPSRPAPEPRRATASGACRRRPKAPAGSRHAGDGPTLGGDAQAVRGDALLSQKSLSAGCTFRYHTKWPMTGSRNQRPHHTLTGLFRPSRWYMLAIS